jgi:uncharacterized membrane protein
MRFNETKRRLTNRVTLLALLAWIYSVLEVYGVTNLLPSNFWEIVILGGVNVFVVLGVINDPSTENKGLGDDK